RAWAPSRREVRHGTRPPRPYPTVPFPGLEVLSNHLVAAKTHTKSQRWAEIGGGHGFHDIPRREAVGRLDGEAVTTELGGHLALLAEVNLVEVRVFARIPGAEDEVFGLVGLVIEEPAHTAAHRQGENAQQQPQRDQPPPPAAFRAGCGRKCGMSACRGRGRRRRTPGPG